MFDRTPIRPNEQVERLTSALEVLINVVFLAQADAELPDKIRHYMDIAEEQVNVLQEIVLPPHVQAKAA